MSSAGGGGVEIDAAAGEGGGQVLRTSLCLLAEYGAARAGFAALGARGKSPETVVAGCGLPAGSRP